MRLILTGLTTAGLLLPALGGCGGAARSSGRQSAASPTAPDRHAPYTAADVQFMSDMIRHHAQAVLIARWIPSRGASDALRRLGERIVVGQQDEQTLMVGWLQDRNQPVPAADSSRPTSSDTSHAGMGHSRSMPGMLTPEQLAQLERTRGQEFDRTFLRLMIVHHQGALVMVDRLFDAPGAAHDDTIFRLASDIHAEQAAEIGRMQKLLDAMAPNDRAP